MEFSRVQWCKSSYSTQQGNCVEVGVWRKSSHSVGNGQCAEVAQLAEGVALRDSMDPGGPVLVFGPDEWRAFLGSVKAGRLDLG